MFALEPLQTSLGSGHLAQEQAHHLGKRPLEMGIADLGPAGADALAGRFVRALHQAAVRDEVLHATEAADVLDFVEQNQRENLAHARDRAEQVVGLGIVDLRGAGQLQLDLVEDLVIDVNEIDIDLDRGLDAGIGEAFGDVLAVLSAAT